jgi:hypothetical protein
MAVSYTGHADEAGYQQRMLHYYFCEKLFEVILRKLPVSYFPDQRNIQF